jgi:hypothetical protein
LLSSLTPFGQVCQAQRYESAHRLRRLILGRPAAQEQAA